MQRRPQPQAAETVEPDRVRIPNMTDPDFVANLRKKTMAAYEAKRGRSSTDLTPSGGDSSYSRTTLG